MASLKVLGAYGPPNRSAIELVGVRGTNALSDGPGLLLLIADLDLLARRADESRHMNST